MWIAIGRGVSVGSLANRRAPLDGFVRSALPASWGEVGASVVLRFPSRQGGMTRAVAFRRLDGRELIEAVQYNSPGRGRRRRPRCRAPAPSPARPARSGHAPGPRRRGHDIPIQRGAESVAPSQGLPGGATLTWEEIRYLLAPHRDVLAVQQSPPHVGHIFVIVAPGHCLRASQEPPCVRHGVAPRRRAGRE